MVSSVLQETRLGRHGFICASNGSLEEEMRLE